MLIVLQGNNILVIGTTSKVKFLESIEVYSAFSDAYHVPALAKAEAIKVFFAYKVIWS